PPGVGYFAGAPNAFAGGMEYAAATRRRRLQENALSALINRFGPEAAMPEEQSMLQATEQRTQLQPHVVGAAERQTAGAEANVEQLGPAAGTVETQGVETREHEQRRSVLHRAVTALRMVRDREGDVRSALPQFGQILTRIGMPPDELQQLEQQIITNPDSLDELDAMLQPVGTAAGRGLSGGIAMRNRETGELEWVIPTESGFRVIPGRTPATAEQGYERLDQGAERLNLGWSNLDFDKVKEYLPSRAEGVQYFQMPDGRIVADVVPGSPAEKEMERNLREAEAGDRKYLQAYNAVSQHGDVVERSTADALAYFKDAGSGLVLQNFRRLAPLAAGTEMHEAWQALEAIKNNIGINELQRMRQSSPTGGAMGNVSDRDIELLTGVLGRLDQIRDPVVLVRELESVLSVYENIRAFAEEDAIAAQYRSVLRQQKRGTSFGPQPRPTSGGVAPGSGATREEMSLDDLLNQYGPGRNP
ncbi:MAG: hypothetical protein ACREK1_04070, partial [Longimicrobiales bacterium]